MICDHLIGRDYDAASERQKSVEEFYRANHIHQTYDFVRRSHRSFFLVSEHRAEAAMEVIKIKVYV